MGKLTEWIKILVPVIAVIVVISFESCVTRREMNEKFEQARADRSLIREDIRRLEDKVERLNQNYIDHLVHHNKREKIAEMYVYHSLANVMYDSGLRRVLLINYRGHLSRFDIASHFSSVAQSLRNQRY